MENRNVWKLFIHISVQRMCRHYLPKLLEALHRLDEEELWRRDAEETNSIGGIVLHICEHIRRNTLQMRNATLQFAQGIEEHVPNVYWRRENLYEHAKQTFSEWEREMESAFDRLHEMDMHRLYHLVEHTAYHLGQIIDRTKQLKRVSFRFCQKGLNEKALKEMIEAKCTK